jgi:thioredoxin reductase
MTTRSIAEQARVVIIGGGPAGLSAAAQLAERLGDRVVVLERDSDAGGIPRHSDHTGYGLRDRRRLLTGPDYARSLVSDAQAAGAVIATHTQVTELAADRTLQVTSPAGRMVLRPDAVLLATGARERPRAARLIPGTRPDGVYTTGQLQRSLHLHHQQVGTRAVVVGAELVSWSAVVSLAHAGCSVAAMTSEYPRPEAYQAATIAGRLRYRPQVLTSTTVVAVHGRRRVEAVDVENLTTGERRRIDCDTLVFTADWIPDNELARMAGLLIDRGSRGPVVDGASRTTVAGVFAAGNLTHPVETADVVALAGAHASAAILAHLSGHTLLTPAVRLQASAPIRWVSPQLYRPGERPARGRRVAWVDRAIARPVVRLDQDGRQIAARRLAWPAAPGRALRLPDDMFDAVQVGRGDVTVSIS